MQRERETKAKTGLSPIKFHNALVATERRVAGRPENPYLSFFFTRSWCGHTFLRQFTARARGGERSTCGVREGARR